MQFILVCSFMPTHMNVVQCNYTGMHANAIMSNLCCNCPPTLGPILIFKGLAKHIQCIINAASMPLQCSLILKIKCTLLWRHNSFKCIDTSTGVYRQTVVEAPQIRQSIQVCWVSLEVSLILHPMWDFKHKKLPPFYFLPTLHKGRLYERSCAL